MGRPKRPTVLTFATGRTPAAVAEVWGSIKLLLLSANHAEPIPEQIARELDVVLTLLSQGVNIQSPRHWPLVPALAFDNLAAIVRTGAYHLRRCPTCSNWFLATHATRRICYRDACQDDLVAKRQAKARRLEQARQRRARVTVKGTARTK
jgi:hypothetical protein